MCCRDTFGQGSQYKPLSGASSRASLAEVFSRSITDYGRSGSKHLEMQSKCAIERMASVHVCMHAMYVWMKYAICMHIQGCGRGLTLHNRGRRYATSFGSCLHILDQDVFFERYLDLEATSIINFEL